MPAFSSHYIFAKELMPLLKSTASFKINEAAVYYGTQGPDIFFSHRVFPWMIGKTLRKTGSAIHRAKPADILAAMRKYLKSHNNSDTTKSYVWGFILHYALDRKCHPYVYSFQEKIINHSPLTNPHTAHNTVEFAMDSYLLNKRLNIKNPVLFNTAQTLAENEDVFEEIANIYCFIVPEIIGEKIKKEQVITALKDLKTVQKTVLDRYGIKKAIITPLEIIISPFTKNFKFSAMLRPRHLEKAKKYGNINNCEWKSPYSEQLHRESFEELFDVAKKEAVFMITAFEEGFPAKEITNNISFLTGVEVK